MGDVSSHVYFARERMKRWVLLAAAGLVSVVATSNAQTELNWSVIANGGSQLITNGPRALSATIGQAIVGRTVITVGSGLDQGFWLPLNRVVGVDEEGGSPLAGDVSNYPNPFSSSTTIRLNLPVEGDVEVRIYDVVGGLVRTLRTSVSLAGGQELEFDGTSDNGMPLSNGTYLYEVTVTTPSGERVQRVQRMSIVR